MKIAWMLLFAVGAVGQIVNPQTGGGGGGAVSSVNGQTGTVVLGAAQTGSIPLASGAATFVCHGFGDSVMAGTFNSPATANYFDTWATTYLPNCTHDNQAVSSYSVQDIATKVYNATFAQSDYTVLGSASNDGFANSLPLVNFNDNYMQGLEALMVYAGIPDGTQAGGYAAKIKGSAVSCSGTGFVTTDQYAIGTKTTHAGDTCTWTFTGDVLYVATSTTMAGGEVVGLSVDGGTAFQYGPYGNNSGFGPYRVLYGPHAGTVTYNPFLIRYPITTGKSVAHTVTWSCVTAPCYLDYMASNGFTQGPKLLMPLFWQNGNYGTQSGGAIAAASQNIMAQYLVDQLSEDGLAVANADTAGYLNYYTNSANWANTLHPNNAGSLALAKALGAVSNKGINPKAVGDKKLYHYSVYYPSYTGFGAAGYFDGLFSPFPIKIESISVGVTGTFATCGGANSTGEYLFLQDATHMNQTYNSIGAHITQLGANITLQPTDNNNANSYFPGYAYVDGFGNTTQLILLGANCTGGTQVNGNENLNINVVYSRF